MEKLHITAEEINQLPLKSWEGDIHVIDKEEQVKKAIDEIRKHKVIGFDTESKPAFRRGEYNPVALLQMALPEKVYLFRINHTGFTLDMASVFEDKNILKVGVAINDDLKELQHFQDYDPKSVIDLASMADEKGILNGGVRGLTALLLGFRISKRQQTSNWENRVLTPAQVSYAATDAWVCLNIYHGLRKFKG